MSIIQLRDLVACSMEVGKQQAVSDVATFVSSKNKLDRVLQDKVAEKISQVLVSFGKSDKNLSLYNIERFFDDGIEVQQELIQECVKETADLYKSKTVEEHKKEISSILSSVNYNIDMVTASEITTAEIEKVFTISIREILLDGLSRTTTGFEKHYLAQEADSLVEDERRSKEFQDYFCSLFGNVVSQVIQIGNNKEVDEVIESFINTQGIITVGAAKELLQNRIFQMCEDVMEQQLEDDLVSIIEKDQEVMACPSVIIASKESDFRTSIKEFITWAKKEIHEMSNNNLPVPSIITKNRIFLFNAVCIKNKGLLSLCVDLKEKIELFLEQNPEAVKRLFVFLRKNVCHKERGFDYSKIEKILPIIVSSIFYYNAAVNGRIDKKALQNMMKGDILVELSKDVQSIKDKIVFSKEHRCYYKSLPEQLWINQSRPWNNISIESIVMCTYEVDTIFSCLLNDANLVDMTVDLMGSISSFILEINQSKKLERRSVPADRDLSMMLMLALNDRAEEFILDSYSEVEKAFLAKAGSSSRLLKSDQVFKAALTTTFLSLLARVTYHRRCRLKAERNVSLQLLESFKFEYALVEGAQFTKENILEIFEKSLLHPEMYSEIFTLLDEDKEFVFEALVNRFKTLLKDEKLDRDTRVLCESTISSIKNRLDVQILMIKFCEFIFPVKTELKKDDKDKEFRANKSAITFRQSIKSVIRTGVPILRIKSFNMVKEPLLDLLNEDFIGEAASVFKEYLQEKPKEFVALQKFFSKLSPTLILSRKDFVTGIQLQHKMSRSITDLMPVAVFSIMLTIWAKHQGLSKLEEKRALTPKELLLEVLSSNQYLEEGLQEWSAMIYTSINRCIFSVASKLCCCRNVESEQQMESEILKLVEELAKEYKEELHFTAIFTSLAKAVKHKTDKEIKTVLLKSAASKQDKQVKKLDEPKVTLQKDFEEGNRSLSRAERHRLHRLELQQKKKEEQERKLKELEEEKNVNEYSKGLKEESSTEEEEMDFHSSLSEQKESAEILTSSNESSGSKSPSEDGEDNVSLEHTLLEDDLGSKTLDEVVYEGQVNALEEMECEFNGLTDEQRQMLLLFASKMKTQVVDKAYRKGAIDNENQRKKQQYVASWGTKYKCEDTGAEAGAASLISTEYTILQPQSFIKWLEKRNPKIQEEINKRFTKIVLEGDLGEVKSLNTKDLGAFEFKFYDSLGTRIYYVPRGKNIYILCGGDKSDQSKIINHRLSLLVQDLESKKDF